MRPGPIPGERGDDAPLQDWMIAVIAGVAGLLLLGIVILCLCCFIRRKKTLGGESPLAALAVNLEGSHQTLIIACHLSNGSLVDLKKIIEGLRALPTYLEF